MKNGLICAKTETVCLKVGCLRDACTPCLSFIFQNLPVGAPCYPQTSAEWFHSHSDSVSFPGLFFFIAIFFVRHWYHHVAPAPDVFSACVSDLFLHEIHSLHMQALTRVSRHNSSVPLFKLCELMMSSRLSLSAFIVALSCPLQMRASAPVADVWSNNPKWLHLPTEK